MTQTQVQEESKRILIPKRTVVNYQGKEFESFEYGGQAKALKNLIDQGYTPVNMPSLIDARIEASKEDRVWQTYFTTPSMIITGKIKNESMVAFDHRQDNYFARDPKNIEEALKALINYAGIVPQKEFEEAVEKDEFENEQKDRLVWVIKGEDYKRFRDSKSGVIPVKNALEHPQTIPFLGGEKRAQSYLQRHKEVYGDRIRIWHADDLSKDDNQPLGRLLDLGSYYGIGLGGYYDLGNYARFVGVRAQNFGSSKTSKPSLEQVLKATQGFVPDVARNDYEAKVKSLFSK